MVKLKDVAKLAGVSTTTASGVSTTTASRVLNNRGYISEKTRNKVNEAMDKLGYYPNAMARSLNGKSTGLIGLIFYDTANPFFGELVSKLETRLFEKGYKTILCDSTDSPEKEKKYLNMLISNQVDGIISGTHNLDIKEYDQIKAPIVSFDRSLSSKVPVVSPDNYLGGTLATEYLVGGGAKNIHIISSHLSSNNLTDKRVKAYLDMLKMRHITLHEHAIPFSTPPTIKRALIKKIFQENKIDGLFCTDDLTALLAYETAKQMGLRINKDIKIVGFDGTDFMRSYFPMISTIKQPLNEISGLLVNILIKRIKGDESEIAENYVLPVELVVGK